MKLIKGPWLLWIWLAPLLVGCECVRDCTLTGKLWDNDQLSNHREPGGDPHLKAFASPDGRDVLVQYDEGQEKNASVRRRAFFLLANQERLWAGKKPRFVSPQTADKLQPVPIAQERNPIPTNTPGLRVVFLPENRQLKMFGNEGEIGTFALPVYVDWRTTGTRIALTPLAVTGDVVIAGTIVGIFALYLYAHGGGCSH